MKYLLFFFFSIFSFGQQIDKVDFIKCDATVSLDFDKKSVSAMVKYEFKVNKNSDSIKIDAINMEFYNVEINNKLVKFTNNKKQLLLFEGYKLGINTITFSYSTTPKQALYFTGIHEDLQIWTQGQGKYTSHWLPSFDDVNEKVIFNINVIFDKEYEVISNGKFIKNTENKAYKSWSYKMQKPMSSYLVMLAIGKFEHKTEKSNSGIKLENYYQYKDSINYQYTFKDSKAVFDFLEKEIGVKYPWQVYRQIPVEDFLYAGMENTSSTIFAQDFVVDENGFNDRNYINVNAHELAHQWFGDLVTAKSGKHHWLQEGFATYYALLSEKYILGDDYFYTTLYGMTQEFKASEKTDSTPVLNEKASSLTFYKKGAFALFVLENEIGHKNFQKAVKNYLKKYSFKSVETDDFLSEVAKICSFDKEKFSNNWLETSVFDFDKANELLSKNATISKLFDLQKLRIANFSVKKNIFEEILKSTEYYTLKEEVLFQIKDVNIIDKTTLLELAFDSNNLKIRQILSNSFGTIPENFRLKYETLLNDNSYETKEIALVQLIASFPGYTQDYLNKTKNIIGFNDKSFEMLWFFWAISTPNYIQNTAELIEKLSNYTSNNFEFSVRQNAFVYLHKLNNLNYQNLNDLLDCCSLPNWRNAKWSREFLQEILKNIVIKQEYLKILPNLTTDKQVLLNKFLYQ